MWNKALISRYNNLKQDINEQDTTILNKTWLNRCSLSVGDAKLESSVSVDISYSMVSLGTVSNLALPDEVFCADDSELRHPVMLVWDNIGLSPTSSSSSSGEVFWPNDGAKDTFGVKCRSYLKKKKNYF